MNNEEKINELYERIFELEDRIYKAREYILQNCEIIRFENEGVDKVGKVEGIPILEILDKGE